MLEELCAELLELTAKEKGYRGAMYASSEDAPGCGSITLCCTLVLCCHLCW
jgi:hypothetical protein